MHLPLLITDLAMILGVAAVVTFLFQKIRQPLVLGYIIAGVIVGPHTPTGLTVTDLPNVQVWAELGVIFLMFSLGLEFTFHKLVRVGVPSVGTAIVEVVLMVLLGYGTGRLLGWSLVDSLFLGGILSISSTTIIIKAFEDLGVKTRRYAEIVFGVLIVEDLVAILLLVALSTVAITQSFFSFGLLISALKLVLIVGSWVIVGYFLIPSFLRYAGKLLNNETLTVLCTALCLLLVLVAAHFNYSVALGAFIMGSILAETSESHRIETLIQPVKDLFAAVFFVSVGMLVDPKMLLANVGPVAIIILVTILGKIISTSVGALITGQPLKRSVQIGFSLAQIGEFSFIIATLGSTLKVTSDFLYPIAVTVSVVTTFTTPYLIRHSERFAGFLEGILPSGVTRRLSSYATWAQSTRGSEPEKGKPTKHLMRFFLNGIVVSLVFLVISEFGLPRLKSNYSESVLLLIGAWALSVLLSAPFVWGMFFAFRSRAPAKGSHPSAPSNFALHQFFAQLGTVVWLGALSSAFFPTGTALILTLIGAAALFFFMYQRLERSYQWFERKFLANIADKKGEVGEESLAALAPWDVHTVRVSLHHNSIFAGKAIKEEEIRKKYGLNIVAIQRGLKVIASPAADEVLFPKDELLVLGADEQIDRFRQLAEGPSGDTGDGRTIGQYFLRRVFIDGKSSHVGESIRDSGLRESLGGLVVGLERGTFRTINPDPATELKAGDVLWVVAAPS